MIFENFGIFVSDVIKDEELTDKQKESVISFKLENMKTPSTSLIDALSDLDELDYGTYGKLSAYMFSNRPRKHSKRSLNEPRCFHNGRPCVRCNKLADYFNKKDIKISLPKQHAYSKCPLYCNLCKSKFGCENIECHLIFSCNYCSKDYCNHPTERCSIRKS
jgi:hypothetical protein